MAQAASRIDIEPRSVSFKATIQILEAFQPVIAHQGHWGKQHLQELYQQLLKAIATHRVADRPDRFEPRMTKRRPKNYDRLTKPRREIKREMIKGLSKIQAPFVCRTDARKLTPEPKKPVQELQRQCTCVDSVQIRSPRLFVDKNPVNSCCGDWRRDLNFSYRADC